MNSTQLPGHIICMYATTNSSTPQTITCLQFSTISVNMNNPSTISIDDGGRGQIHPHQSYLLGDINIDQSYNSIHPQDNVSTDYVDIPHPQTNEAYSPVKTTSPQDYAPGHSVPQHSEKECKGKGTGASPHRS
jgi:hypothetical protein